MWIRWWGLLWTSVVCARRMRSLVTIFGSILLVYGSHYFSVACVWYRSFEKLLLIGMLGSWRRGGKWKPAKTAMLRLAIGEELWYSWKYLAFRSWNWNKLFSNHCLVGHGFCKWEVVFFGFLCWLRVLLASLFFLSPVLLLVCFVCFIPSMYKGDKPLLFGVF